MQKYKGVRTHSYTYTYAYLSTYQPTYIHSNYFVVDTGQSNCDLRKLSVNLVPFPRLHFFTISYAPLTSPTQKNFKKMNVQLLTKGVFDNRSFMCAADPRKGRYISVCVRGCVDVCVFVMHECLHVDMRTKKIKIKDTI